MEIVQFLKQKLVQESNYNNNKTQNIIFLLLLWKHITVWIQRKVYTLFSKALKCTEVLLKVYIHLSVRLRVSFRFETRMVLEIILVWDLVLM